MYSIENDKTKPEDGEVRIRLWYWRQEKKAWSFESSKLKPAQPEATNKKSEIRDQSSAKNYRR